jgi:hypothetical protein
MPKTNGKSFDVSFRKGTPPDTHFVKLGVAFLMDNGRIDVKLDALPIGEWDGRLTLFPHKES